MLTALLTVVLGIGLLTSNKTETQNAEDFKIGIETAITDAHAGHWGNMVQKHYAPGYITDGMENAKVIPADTVFDWNGFEYQSQLSWGERTCRFGWSPSMPDVVYGQWIEGGSYTQPVWIRSRDVALGVISGVTRWDGDCRNTMHFQKVENGKIMEDYTFSDYIPMNTLAQSLAECTLTDRTPICGDGKEPDRIDYYTIKVDGYRDAVQYTYIFYIYPDESYETWYVEMPGEQVYVMTDGVRNNLRREISQYDAYLRSPVLTVVSGEKKIMVEPSLPSGLGDSFQWIQTLETVPDKFGLPFELYDESGEKLNGLLAFVSIGGTGSSRTEIGDNLSPINSNLGQLYPGLKTGETYRVSLALTLEDKGDIAIYYFNIIPQ